MRNIKFIFIISVLFFYTALGYANEFPQGGNISLPHKIDYQLPGDASWQLENRVSDNQGYTEIYKSDVGGARHRIFLNYGRNIKTPLAESMKQVLQSHLTTNCKIQDSKILKKGSNFLIFSTLLDKCPNNLTIEQIYKVFNMPDGQYSIMYATNNPKPIDPAFLNKLKDMVMSSRIV